MKYSIRSLFLAVFAMAVFTAIAISLARFLTHDPVAAAAKQLQRDGAVVVKLIDNGRWRGGYACVRFKNVDRADVDTDALRIVRPDVVDLSGTNWSDADLIKLYGLQSPQIILTDTRVTQAGIDQLKANLGDSVVVTFDPQPGEP